ncbi:M28 family peptidase [Litorimonas haliclonae]|uniref:M28 family peptidase n=1 Tax=Litorimonas haliclonae TaxID=2081977 RepID=UPI0039EFAE61
MKRPNGFGLALLIVFLFAAATLRQLSVSPPDIQSDHVFDTAEAFTRLERLLDDETPHPVDSDANDEVRERLVAEITDLGFEPIIRDDFICKPYPNSASCARVQNVMFWLNEPGPEAVMIASHYDSVPAGPGASDDGIGVAASLEIASVLKGRDLAKPVLVLMTDGEETGLIGAHSFVKKDPFASLIGSVVSMEARGVRGPVAMFQTGTPNQRDIQALKTDIRKPLTSSLAAAVYDIMPSDTDVTEFLPLEPDVANYAVGEGVAFYHTPGDNLANLDKRSLFHMGANGLSAVEAYLETPMDDSEGQWLYTDIFGFFILSMPLIVGMGLVAFGLLGAIVMFVKSDRDGGVRAFFFPPAALLLGAGLAIALTFVVASIRPEASFAFAQPWVLRAAQSAAGLLGAFLALKFMARNVSGLRLASAGWVWFALFGGLMSVYLPGGLILFAPPLALIALAGLLSFLGARLVATLLSVLAAITFLVIILPASAFAEIMLFLEYSAPLTILYIFCFIFLAPLCLSERLKRQPLGWAPAVGLAVVSLGFLICAIFVPAYSPESPQPLSIAHVESEDDGTSQWVFGKRDPLPKTMREVTQFNTSPDDPDELSAQAPEISTEGMRLNVIRDSVRADRRTVTLRIDAPESDRIYLGLQGSAETKFVSLNGLEIEGQKQNIVCSGRSCRNLELNVQLPLGAKLTTLGVSTSYFGLGPESRDLLEARPDWAMPIQLGDRRIRSKTIELVAQP